MPTLSLTIVEIIVLMLGAIVLGITIHFFIVSRRNLRSAVPQFHKSNKVSDELKTRYNSDMELKEKEIASLRQSLEEEKENSNIYNIEAEEQRNKNKKLKEEIAALKMAQQSDTPNKPDFTDQLRQAQKSLTEQNDKLSNLLDQIDNLKSSSERQEYFKQENEDLANRIMELETRLLEKEKEISNIRQKAHLTKEMSSMLDNAYNEFQVLQSKIEKLELQAGNSKMNSVELENVREENLKLSRELEENKQRLQVALNENQQLKSHAVSLEDELKEAEFLQQQLEKKISYLEELNNDLQAVSDTNKKLEGQIKRIGELESMLNMLAEERDQLMRKQKRDDR
jgi:chromosome segregation ATPase